MSKLTYNLGFMLGTLARELLHTVRKPKMAPTKMAQAHSSAQLPPPCIPDSLVRDMDHIPAMVRAKGVDLNLWYAANTRVIEKASRKRRTRPSTRQLKPAVC